MMWKVVPQKIWTRGPKGPHIVHLSTLLSKLPQASCIPPALYCSCPLWPWPLIFGLKYHKGSFIMGNKCANDDKKNSMVCSLSCSLCYFLICPLWLWSLTLKIHRINCPEHFPKSSSSYMKAGCPSVCPFWSQTFKLGLLIILVAQASNLVGR